MKDLESSAVSFLLEDLSTGAHVSICIAEVSNNKTMILFEMQGAALLLIVLWPPGKGHEENKNFLRGSFKKERHFPSSMWYRKLQQHETCHWICRWVEGWGGYSGQVLIIPPLASDPLLSQHSSLICHPGEYKEYLSHLLNSLHVPPRMPEGNCIYCCFKTWSCGPLYGEGMWHSIRDGGLIPARSNHTMCV